jgi:acyl-CoA reductase-like NAD-dependent aldehyde dehydrogenase
MDTITALSSRSSVDPLGADVFGRMRRAQLEWSATPIRTRLRVIRQLRGLLPMMTNEFCDAVEADIHKPAAETIGAELLPVAAACRFLEKHARQILRNRRYLWWDTPIWLFGEKDWVVRKPRGIIGIIGTWNYPYFLNGVQIVHALAAGNAVAWKPSEVTPRSAEVLTRWFRAGGVSDDLLQVLPPDRQWGGKLAEAPVDHIVFTGHDATGRKLAARLGERLISSTLELSGHDAVLVLEDADLDLAARAILFGTTVNAGQTCLATRRVFVARNVYDNFLDRLKPLFQRETETRPLAQSQQVQRVQQIIEEALKEGARLLLDKKLGAVGQFSPAVVVDVQPEMAINQQALFAPVVAVLPFEDISEAIAGVTISDYGLGLSIFTAKVQQAFRLAQQLPAGLVTINDTVAPVAHPATPFGGVGRSGWGATQGAEGLLEMTVPQVISMRRGRWRPHFDKPGSTVATNAGVLGALLRWQNSSTMWQRCKCFFTLLRAARQAKDT